MYKLLLLLSVLLCGCIIASSQEAPRDLKIGDTLPAFHAKVLVGKSEIRSINRDSVRGKLLILDFWNRHCTACIASFPKMEALQNKYNEKVKVLLVTQDKKGELEQLMNRSPIMKNLNLPIITGDSLFHALFPHPVVPFVVWIDQRGIVREFSRAEVVSEAIIEKRLMHWGREPGGTPGGLKAAGADSADFPFHHVKFSGYSPDELDWGIRLFKDRVTNRTSLVAINQDLQSLIRFVNKDGYHQGRIRYKGVGELRFTASKDENTECWNKKNLFCYEVSSSEIPLRALRDCLRADIARVFNLKMEVRRLPVECYVLKLISDGQRLAENDGSLEPMCEYSDKYGLFVQNSRMARFFLRLEWENRGENPPIFIDETGISGNVSFHINGSVTDMAALKHSLMGLGLSFEKEIRELNVLVVEGAGRK